MTLLMSRLMVTEVPLVERHFLDWTFLLCFHQWAPPEAAVRRTEGCALVLLVPSNPLMTAELLYFIGKF